MEENIISTTSFLAASYIPIVGVEHISLTICLTVSPNKLTTAGPLKSINL